MSRAARLGWALSRSAFGYRCSLVLSILDPSVISPLFWGDGIPRLSVLSCHCCSPSGRPCTSLGPRPCPSPLCAALVGPGICERDGGSRGDEETSSPRVCFLVLVSVVPSPVTPMMKWTQREEEEGEIIPTISNTLFLFCSSDLSSLLTHPRPCSPF